MIGHETATAYHPFLGQPTSVTDVANNQVKATMVYDALGRVVSVTDAFDLTTSQAYALTTAGASDWTKTQTVSDSSGFNGVAGSWTNGTYPVTAVSVSSVYAVRTTAAAKPAVTTYYDRLGGVIRTVRKGFGTQKTVADTAYNNLGQVTATSLPYPEGTAASSILWTRTAYDALGRAATITAPNGTITTNTYAGRTTTVKVDATDRDPQFTVTEVDAKGRTVKVWNPDPLTGLASGTVSLQFRLDGFGRMRETWLEGSDGTVATKRITATYDAHGRQLSLNDPDKGNWTYVNNALGQIVSQTDAKANVTSSTFDKLGRPLTRVTTSLGSGGDGSTETAGFYYYDTSTVTTADRHTVAKGDKGWIGAPQREEADTTGAPGFNAPATVNLHYYDAKGRRALELAQTDGKWFYTATTYDSYSRPESVRHYWKPAGAELPSQQPYVWQDFGYTYNYDTKSYLLSITDTLGRAWWEVAGTDGYDHLDRAVKVRKGNGYWTKRDYRATDGVLTNIRTGVTAGATDIQNMAFGFDGLGNLTSRSDTGVSESYGYDHLNRLEKRNGGVIAAYHPNGNMLSKTEVAGTTVTINAYAANRPHAVSQYAAGGQTYDITYDGNGNMLTRSGGGATWSLQWAGFDKPRWMAKNGVGSEFHYNANRSRVLQLEFDQMSGTAPNQVPSRYVRKRTYALGSTLELNYTTIAPALSPTWDLDTVRIYVPGPDGIIGAREFRPGLVGAGAPSPQEKALVYHYDHLGSITAITDWGSTSGYSVASGNKTGRYSEDAWGQRRDPLDWSGVPSTATDDGGTDSLTPRGFTGHEMLDDLGLVHMNGRIYDPLLGRFLSADLLVQFPSSLQSYNRYSYVSNNPLSATDPSGFAEESWWSKLATAWQTFKATFTPRVDDNAIQSQQSDQIPGGQKMVALGEVSKEVNAVGPAAVGGLKKGAVNAAADMAQMGALAAGGGLTPQGIDNATGVEGLRESINSGIDSTTTENIISNGGNPSGLGRAVGDAGGQTLALTATVVLPVVGEEALALRTASLARSTVAAKTATQSTALVVYDKAFAAGEFVGMSPGGRTLTFHALKQMTNPPAWRAPMTALEVDKVLDTADKIIKIQDHAKGPTLTIRSTTMPGQPQVVIDAATGKRVITVIKDK